jgi:hypothetical protein
MHYVAGGVRLVLLFRLIVGHEFLLPAFMAGYVPQS